MKTIKVYFIISILLFLFSCRDWNNPYDELELNKPLITNEVANIEAYSATIYGNIETDGGSDIIEKGIVYSNNQNPTIDDDFIISEETSDNFTCILNGLTENTNYFVCAYAKNSIGISYGDELSLNTLSVSLKTDTLESSDYQILVDWVFNNDTLNPNGTWGGYLSQYQTEEFYFGASSYYKNFDMRVSRRRVYDPNGYLTNMTDEQATEELYNRLSDAIIIILESSYQNEEPIENGSSVVYEIIFSVFSENLTNESYKIKCICVSTGKFEYIENSLTLLE